MRVIIGGLIGGVVIFGWGAAAHMLTPLGHMGLRTIPKEQALVSAMKEGIPAPGLYFFPGRDLTRELTKEEDEAWKAMYKQGPTGLLLYKAGGGLPPTPKQLATELASNVLAAILAAYILASSNAGYLGRVIIATLFGVITWMDFTVSYWNWYGFPSEFAKGEAIMETVGWFAAGLFMAAYCKPQSPK